MRGCGVHSPHDEHSACFLATAIGVAALGVTTGTAAAVGQQPEWFFCDKCYGMFFNGYIPRGVCPAGGQHRAQGWNFHLPYEMQWDNNNQRDWRYCYHCHGMFFDGFGPKGACPTGGGHVAEGWNFTLPHNYEPIPANSQADWRYCYDCYGLFFDGYPTKGVCPVDGPHRARSRENNFNLPHLP